MFWDAVSEFAIYFKPSLAKRNFNLQFKIPLKLARAQDVFTNHSILLSYQAPTGPECSDEDSDDGTYEGG